MSSDFLTSLANQISDQFGLGENNTHSLDIVESGHVKKYGKLGELSKRLDQSAQRKYVETGYIRTDQLNVKPDQFELLLQEPDATIIVKKRAFSTLSENYRSDFMNAEEKLYIKATKILFQNKCRQISNFEKLSKIERVSSVSGRLDEQLLPLIISLVDESDQSSSFIQTKPSGFDKLKNIVDKIRKIYSFSDFNKYTSWIEDNSNIFKTTFGQGTGVIELTNVIDFSTHTTINFGSGGNFNINISDPYKLMWVTNHDIEMAISDSLNFVSNTKIYQLGVDSLDKIAENNINRLNQARASRGASNIQFISSPDTLLGKRLVAIAEGVGVEINFSYNAIPKLSSLIDNGGVNISEDSLKGGALLGVEGLDTKRTAFGSEKSLFQDAVSALFTAMEFRKSSQSSVARQGDFQDPAGKSKLDINYVRRKLRQHYGNKLIIQPMDRVHIYVGSKSRSDNKVLSGLQSMFNGLNFFQNLNNNVYDLNNQFTSLFNPSANISMQLEKTVFVGSDFPNALWAMMRNVFVNDNSGCHVFGGVVDQANRDFSQGSYRVSVSGKDNTVFFEFGPLNLNPGVDAFNGPLYDPLTPFKTKFDAINTNFDNQQPEFLDENKELLSSQSFNDGLIRFKSGRNIGKPATLNNIFGDKAVSNNKINNIYHAIDGLVYKWKEGIGTFTYSGDSFNATNPNNIGVPAITTNPFAGQDIMNVLSLLITGIPYNFATYYKASREFDSFGRDPHTGQDPAASFYQSLNTTLSKNNLLWGAFIPFKNLVIDDKTYNDMLLKQQNVLQSNSIIDNQLSKIQDLQNKLWYSGRDGSQNNQAQTDSLLTSLVLEKAALNMQVEKLKEDIKTSIPLTIMGNDVSFDPDQAEGGSKSLSNPNIRAELRKKINFLTRKLSWTVRANEDKNLFIVDDTYDKDYDILAYEKQLKGKIEQFANEYTTVKEKINSVASLLNLEIFCDTQGHIRVRPQQYNKMPSSVFYRMMQMKQTNNIQIFPSFMENLFTDQITSLINRLEVLELQIRLDGAILGITDDDKLSNYLTSSKVASGGNFVPFKFFSDQNGDISDIKQILKTANPDDQLDKLKTNFNDKLKTQNSITSIFNAADRAKLVLDIISSTEITSSITTDFVNKLSTLIFKKSGQQITLENFTIDTATNQIKKPDTQVDVLKVAQDLGVKVSERQKLVKTLNKSFENAQEMMKLDADPRDTSNKLLFPSLYDNKNIPETFAHMIEDESFDDLGPNSGSRYVIKEHQILKLNIGEAPPPYTMVEVQGQFDPFISTGNLPAGLQGAFASGGNALVAAAAVDYDMWRMYGFRNMHAIHAPYLSDPEAQCAPYAAFLLSRARRDIQQGTLTIAGNEFMQPGEVIYIESEDLLFYVESVSHNFTFGNSFTTTLKLIYGHNPGEYIPTALDIVGKLLYNSRDTATSMSYRQSNSMNEIQLGAIVINPSVKSNEDLDTSNITDAIVKGPYGDFNIKNINNILYTAAGIVSMNKTKNSNVKTKLELRIFYNSKNGSIDTRLASARDNLKQIFTGFAQLDDKNINKRPNLAFEDSDVKADASTNVDTTNKNETRSPSQKAVDLARNLLTAFPTTVGTETRGSNLQIQNKILNAMSGYIIDCVLKVENVV